MGGCEWRQGQDSQNLEGLIFIRFFSLPVMVAKKGKSRASRSKAEKQQTEVDSDDRMDIDPPQDTPGDTFLVDSAEGPKIWITKNESLTADTIINGIWNQRIYPDGFCSENLVSLEFAQYLEEVVFNL